MKSFNEIYVAVVKSSKEELERIRKKTLIQTIMVIIICLLAITVCVSLRLNGQLCAIFFVIAIFVCDKKFLNTSNIYRKLYKEKVVQTFIKEYDENLEFCYQKGIPCETYQEGGFEHFDSYLSEDLIMGNIDGYDIMLAEILTKDESIDSEGNRTTSIVFQGLFGMSKLNKVYNGMMKIHADKGLFGKVFQDKKRIEMDSSEFEKYFDVIADDKVQAMQILTSDIMDKMLDFMKNSKIKYELTIRNDKLYIRFKTGPMFEGNILKSAVDFDTLKKVYDVINFTFDITRAMVKVTDDTNL